MDITDTPDLGATRISTKSKSVFPKKMYRQDEVEPMLGDLSKTEMKTHLEKLTSFHTRYYKSDYGRQSSEWLLSEVNSTIAAAGADKHGVTVRHFKHSWGQDSIIATIPGRSNLTIFIS